MKIPDIRKIKPGKLINPIPEASRIFKCDKCEEHKYWPEKVGISFICKDCQHAIEANAIRKADQKAQAGASVEVQHSSDGVETNDGKTETDPVSSDDRRSTSDSSEDQSGDRSNE